MSRNINLKKKTVVIVLVIIAILCLVITFGSRNGSFRDFLGKVGYTYQRCGNSQGVFAFYNVENADASFVYTNQSIGLIDTGLKETAGILLKNLNKLNVNTLDFVVITHPHSDHAGGYLELIKEIQVKRLFIGLYTQKDFNNISLYNEIIKTSNQMGIELIYVTYGLTVTLGDIHLQFYDGSHSSSDENHNSLLVKATIGSKSCLYTGDAGQQAELLLLNLGCDLKADILKVGHHGSNSASSEAFLQAVSPNYSVISVGFNDYGHPHPETIHRLAEADTRVYRTDICEKILFQVQENTVGVTVE